VSDVVDLQAEREKRRPHSTGRARCLDCKHEWQSVAPSGTVWLECPKCSLVRGRFIFPHELPEGTGVWHCNCGNTLFEVLVDGFFCPNCGVKHEGLPD